MILLTGVRKTKKRIHSIPRAKTNSPTRKKHVSEKTHPSFFLSGRVISGTGQAARFLQIPKYAKPLSRALGRPVYAGTLNLQVNPAEKKRFLSKCAKQNVPAFLWNNQKMGGLTFFRARTKNQNVLLVVPEKTRHPANVLELAAASNLRKKLGLHDGDAIELSPKRAA